MSDYLIVGLAVVLGPIITALVMLRRAPAEARKITVDTVDVNVKIAGELRDDALDDRKAARAELAQLRADFDNYRTSTDKRIADLLLELRGERAEKVALAAENAALVQRVTTAERRVADLEAEVARLKKPQTSHPLEAP